MRLAVLKSNVPFDSVLVETPDESEKYEIYVGRAEDCHVRIDDPLISRHHFLIASDENGWHCKKISQLGSLHVSGKDQGLIPLHEGDEIKCGIYSFIISEIGNSARLPLTGDYQKAHKVIEEQSLTSVAPVAAEHAPLSSVSQMEEVDLPESLQIDSEPGDEALIDLGDSHDLVNDDLSPDQNVESFKEEALTLNSDEESPSEFNGDVVVKDEFGMSALGEDEPTRVDQNFVHFELILFGEHAPYDRYTIAKNEVFIGRDPNKCQIILTDPEVSSVHSVLKKSGGTLLLEDLNSSNGTILNGQRINRSNILPGDEFVIGSTSFTLKVKSELLDSERDRLMPVEQGQVIEKEEIEEVLVESDASDGDFESNAPVEKSILKRVWKNPEQRKKLIYGLAFVAMLWALFGEEETDIPQDVPKKSNVSVQKKETNKKAALVLSKELEQKRNIAYELGVSYFDQFKFFEALKEFETVTAIDPNYKKVDTYLKETRKALKKVEELEAERRAEEERIKNKKLIEELMIKARAAVKERQVQLAENFFTQIIEKDPENIEVQQLKLELESWQKEEERKALELATKQAQRKRMVDSLSPGKTLYLKKEWYMAILKLEDFLRKQGMDEDLVKEASDMLSDAKNELASALGPLIGKARSLKEGQDLKAAYEAYQEVLKLEPTNAEALNEVDDIKSQLTGRSKKIYREGIIAESLSLFSDAKEKFQEVQQISPTDSDYYKKATEKLKNYLE